MEEMMPSNHKKLFELFTVVIAMVLCVAVSAFAQPTGQPRTAEQNYGNVKLRLSFSSHYQFESDIDDGGRFSLYRIAGGLNVLYPINPCTTVDTSFGYDYLNYDFSDGGYRRFPWDKIHTGTIRSVLRWRESEKWEYFAGPIFTLGMEEGADWKDSLGGGLTAGFKYFSSDILTIGFGLGGLSRLEKSDPLIIPYIILDWKFAPRWQLRNAILNLGAGGGAGLELAWRCLGPLELGLGGQVMRRDFRLSESGRVADGIGQERGYHVYVMANMDVTRNMRISAFGGGIVNGKVRLEDKNGDAIRSEDYDATPIAGARIGFLF